MFYTTLWCNSSEENFKKSVPLHFLGNSLRHHKSGHSFNLVFLEGIDLLSGSYIESLKTFGFNIIDYSQRYPGLIDRFSSINKFYGVYERNCYLRWLALKDVLFNGDDSAKQFWHLDSDVIMHSSLDDLANDTKGKTFMLQGCPVFLSVSDMSWFTSYESELQIFNADIKGYCEKAALDKKFNKNNDFELCNESLFGNPFTHDQDLIEYLISSKKIVQNNASTVFTSQFYYIQNALSLNHWHGAQCNSNSNFLYKENHTISIEGKAVPFIHYQNTFTGYASNYLFLEKLRLPSFVKEAVLKFEIDNENFKTSIWFRLISKFLKITSFSKSREEIIEILSNPKNRVNIATLLNFIKSRSNESRV